MKKLNLLFFIFIFILCSCQSKSTDILSDFVNNFYLTAEVSHNDVFSISDTYSYNDSIISVSWSSDDEDIISNDGKVTFYEDDMTVNILGIFTYESKSISKTFSITVKAVSTEEMLEIASKDISITQSTTDPYEFNYNLPAKVKYNDKRISCEWTSDYPDIISNKGIYNYPEKETKVTLSCVLSYDKINYTAYYSILALPFDKTIFENELNKLSIPSETDEDILLPDEIAINEKTYLITWKSSLENVLSNEGKISYVSLDTVVTYTASITIKNVLISKDYKITVKPISGKVAISNAISKITIPNIISNDILLITDYDGVQISWSSSDTSALSNDGKINKQNSTFKQITLTAKFVAGNEKETIEFTTQVSYQSHMFIDRTFDGEKINTEIKNGKLVLVENELTGSYTTNVIETNNFDECVGSYSATSSTTETCELCVRIRINGKWSKYFSYGVFGKGLKNGYNDQTDTYSKLSVDEIMVTNGQADAFQLKITLNRSNLSETGPVLSLLALTLNFIDYTYNVDISNLPKEIKHDVPKLYQHVVPSIGNIICSITSSTMLMLYRGYSFDGLADYPHQYMAGILKDYTHNIYGNWSYNCIGMGSFGANAYVKRFTNYDELMHHLYYVGPVAASIKGTFVTDAKTYSTNGHLIVITGYKIENNNIYFYINDPNIYTVSTKCTLAALTNVNRMVSYVIE